MAFRALALLLAVPASAMAHSGHVAGLGSGLLHPLIGLDHVLAMAGIGFWAACRSRPGPVVAIGLACIAALLAGQAFGLGAGMSASPEFGLAASVALLGVLILGGPKLPGAVGVPLVVAFAFVHGHAHGAEMGAGVGLTAMPFVSGLVVTSVLLLAVGALIAAQTRRFGCLQLAEHGFGGALCGIGAALLIAV